MDHYALTRLFLIQGLAKQGFLFKHRCSKIEKSTILPHAGIIFSAFSEYNFTLPKGEKMLDTSEASD